MFESLVVVLTISILCVIFVVGWILGSKSKENKIKLEGMKNVVEVQKKISESFNKIDETIDDVESMLN